MTLVCTYPIDDCVRTYRDIQSAVDRASGGSQCALVSSFSGEWTTTISGLTEGRELHFKVLVGERCSVTDA